MLEWSIRYAWKAYVVKATVGSNPTLSAREFTMLRLDSRIVNRPWTSSDESYSYARANFAELLDRVVDEREAVITKRRRHLDVALIAADDLRSL